ncbi:hypothetical protein [Lactiplantibacillus plantarum]|uniref:hypothetical protein n=1 Tax=Lactiplantibacillus plantarum TaxID=1590 RepID=UPI0007AB3044|nr:hypothetical protein [Lactiplantibacillus plantarum]KZE02746.1 hypothetical protein FBR6_0478 [Lactiplantibacillus plantarum]MBU7468782.1 hypothetical protein [Lactiplantibacillus plantarum]MCK3677862.1 hypothetical protein [Lactiplantibacillus plantarum]MCS8623196.1 hypothetical protein [Lactiplantibacillus plantarum]MDT7023271.1 hypothetical protein [Lactiplantibacillus plantarum]
MNNELAVLASELPVLQTKEPYKYLKEVTGNGAYYQVAWQKLADGYVALYGKASIQMKTAPILNDVFEDEEGRQCQVKQTLKPGKRN